MGNSRTRTEGQKRLAREQISHAPEEKGPFSLVAFTDGSTLTNPGAGGAAAIIYTNGMNSQPIIRTEAISSFSTNYHGELRAIKLALAYACTYILNHQISEVRLFSDCQSALTSVSSGKMGQNHTSTISEIRAHISGLEEKNITTLGTWICGHAELEPNELADKHARLAAEEAREYSHQSSTSLSEAQSTVKLMTLSKWQRGWHKSSKGRQLYSLLPSVKRSTFKSIHNRTAERKINRLRIGHTNFKADLAHKNIV